MRTIKKIKLIIEVDEKYYEACKDAVNESYPSQIEEVIANGMPYEEILQGEWKLISIGLTYKYQCSLCGRTISTTPMFLADYPFCHCGAKMSTDILEVKKND